MLEIFNEISTWFNVGIFAIIALIVVFLGFIASCSEYNKLERGMLEYLNLFLAYWLASDLVMIIIYGGGILLLIATIFFTIFNTSFDLLPMMYFILMIVIVYVISNQCFSSIFRNSYNELLRIAKQGDLKAQKKLYKHALNCWGDEKIELLKKFNDFDNSEWTNQARIELDKIDADKERRETERESELTPFEKEAIRRHAIYGSGSLPSSEELNSLSSFNAGTIKTSAVGGHYSPTVRDTEDSAKSLNVQENMRSGIIVRDTGGNMTVRVEGENLRDDDGNWIGNIRNGKFYDCGGTYIGEFRGSHLYDAKGNRQGEMRGKHFYDVNGNWKYRIE